MKRMADVAGQPLMWSQPKATKQSFDLRAGDDIVATLVFKSTFGSLATGEAAPGRWTFKRQGFFKPTVTVRPDGSEQDLAVFRNNTWKGGGTIELADGRHWLASTNFWQTRYDITTADEQVLVTFSRTTGLLHLGTTMTVTPLAGGMPELPWLAILGWYLKILLYRDSSAAAAAAAAG